MKLTDVIYEYLNAGKGSIKRESDRRGAYNKYTKYTLCFDEPSPLIVSNPLVIQITDYDGNKYEHISDHIFGYSAVWVNNQLLTDREIDRSFRMLCMKLDEIIKYREDQKQKS